MNIIDTHPLPLDYVTEQKIYYKIEKTLAIISLYSKRKRAKDRPVDDVFNYEEIPKTLRVQIIQKFEEASRQYSPYGSPADTFTISPDLLQELVKVLRAEYGMRTIGGDKYHRDYLSELDSFIAISETDHFLDCVELYCKIVENDNSIDRKTKELLINEVNHRFLEAGLGYEFDREIIKIDSKLVHSGAVKPVIKLLSPI